MKINLEDKIRQKHIHICDVKCQNRLLLLPKKLPSYDIIEKVCEFCFHMILYLYAIPIQSYDDPNKL